MHKQPEHLSLKRGGLNMTNLDKNADVSTKNF